MITIIISLITTVAVLAVFFVPHALAIYFSGWRKAEREDYVREGR